MTVKTLEKVRLPLLSTATPFEMQSRAGTGDIRLQTEGNSILSSLCIAEIDPGTTLRVWYTDSTTGEQFGEEFYIGQHPIFDTADPLGALPYTDRRLFTKIHNKTRVRYEVTGGSCTFGLYITVVSSFASDLDSALVTDGETFEVLTDEAMPMAGLSDTLGAFKHLRVDENGALVISGAVESTSAVIKDKLDGQVVGLAAAGVATLIDYTVPMGKTFSWVDGLGTGDEFGDFTVEIDGDRWLRKHNTYEQANVPLALSSPKVLTGGQNIVVKVENTNYFNQAGNYEAFIYGVES